MITELLNDMILFYLGINALMNMLMNMQAQYVNDTSHRIKGSTLCYDIQSGFVSYFVI